MAVSRQTPGYGNLAYVRDPVLRQTLQTLFDRISGLDQLTRDLQDVALVGTSTHQINAGKQRVVNALDPLDPQDLVTKRYLTWFVNNLVANQQVEAGAGDGEGDGCPGFDPFVELPDFAGEVNAYAAAHPAELADTCISSGGSWAFMDGLVEHLRGFDQRFGFNGKRGDVNDPSHDAIAYYAGPLPAVNGDPNAYVIDVITAICLNPGPGWIDQTCKGGAGAAWLYPRPA